MSSSYVFKVAQQGQNADTADNKDLIYSSEFNSFKIAEQGTAESVGGADITISHSLGYEATYMTYLKWAGEDSYVIAEGRSYITDTELVVENLVDNGDKVSYMIFYDPADPDASDYTREKADDYGIKISQTDNDVKNCPENKLSLSSSYPTLQIRDVFTSMGPAANSTVSIPHNYGYFPAFIAQIKTFFNGNYYYYELPLVQDGGMTYPRVYCRSKVNSIEIVTEDGFDASSNTVRIVLFTEALE